MVTKPHVHAKGSVTLDSTGELIEPAWEKRLKNFGPSLWAINEQLTNWLAKDFAFEDLTSRYHFDNDSALEYIIIEGKTLGEDVLKIDVHVFSCFCTEMWASKGKPPF